jgi:hypothetical protein
MMQWAPTAYTQSYSSGRTTKKGKHKLWQTGYEASLTVLQNYNITHLNQTNNQVNVNLDFVKQNA